MKFNEIRMRHRIAIVISFLWLCVVFLIALDRSEHHGHNGRIWSTPSYFDYSNFVMSMFIFGIIPMLLVWGFVWILSSRTKRCQLKTDIVTTILSIQSQPGMIPSEQQRDHCCSATKKRRTFVSVGSSIIILIVIIFGAKLLGRQAGQQAARHDFQQELITQNAPTGFMGAEWLMSKSQVKSLFPDAIELVNNDLKLDSTAFTRPAFIDFVFRDNLLVMIFITFKGEKNERLFRLTHLLVTSEYGTFPEPVRTNEFILISKKHVGNISIEHNFWIHKQHGNPIEQIMLYKMDRHNEMSNGGFF